MVNKQRMIDEFIELTSIDSLSLKEREIADVLTKKLKALGLDVFEDDAGEKAGGNSGNLICTVKGNADYPAIILMAHMDTVVPGIGKKPRVDGNYIKTDGTTILGGDDLAGVVSILEAIRMLKESGTTHGDIQIAFTIAEEIGLVGAKNLDYSKIYAKYGVVLDSSGSIGTISVCAPSQYIFKITVTGKAAHAGIEPEKGISAIEVAGRAISMMKLGRIDEITTANIGKINGGRATNIVCDTVEIEAEARSIERERLENQKNHMKECFEKAAKDYGATIEFHESLEYESFNVRNDENLVALMKTAAEKSKVELKLETTGGGSDTNVINTKGIKGFNIAIGMDKVHTVNEQICIDDLTGAANFLFNIVTSAGILSK